MFAVIAGNESARQIYPRRRFAMSSPETRFDAEQGWRRLHADGGTAIGRWLMSANELFESVPDAIRHAILLTDGKNDHEGPEQLQETLSKCAGNFQCDCRGVGTDWNVQELRAIASTLLGTVDIIPEPEEMPGRVRVLIDGAMNKATNDVTLEVWTPQGSHVSFISRSHRLSRISRHPATRRRARRRLSDGCVGKRVARLSPVRHRVSPARGGGDARRTCSCRRRWTDPAQARVRAVWTDDPALSTRINREVGALHRSGRTGSRDPGRSRCVRGRDAESATAKLGRAYSLAAECGNDATVQLLAKVIEVEDATAGTVRLRRDVALVDEMTLDTRSTKRSAWPGELPKREHERATRSRTAARDGVGHVRSCEHATAAVPVVPNAAQRNRSVLRGGRLRLR